MKVLNIFKTTAQDEFFFNTENYKVEFELGDYKIYKMFDKSYLYTYKNVSFSIRMGANKDLIKMLFNNEVSEEPHFKRALHNIERAKKYL